MLGTHDIYHLHPDLVFDNSYGFLTATQMLSQLQISDVTEAPPRRRAIYKAGDERAGRDVARQDMGLCLRLPIRDRPAD
ncbi:hypothetical protein EVAR_38513_1 [Eumeta japonica]|uniref:Uncharacterized protein n=1 Tax=Eumeta variegata TaxID=151549 RepID=A0A4C1WBV0_EUMVA|nr:hypothetical protein EVAR_38513_1 [Eumeta japonica]